VLVAGWPASVSRCDRPTGGSDFQVLQRTSWLARGDIANALKRRREMNFPGRLWGATRGGR